MNQKFIICFFVCLVSLSKGCYSQGNSSQNVLEVVHSYYRALRTSDEKQIRKYEGAMTTVVMLDGREIISDGSHLDKICAWERALQHESNYQVLKVEGSKVTVLLRENNDFYKQLGVGMMTEVTECTVESGKIVKFRQRLYLHENDHMDEVYASFKAWLLGLPGISEPSLISSEKKIKIDGESAPRMIYWLKKWNESGANPRKEKGIPEKLVSQYCQALTAIDPKQIEHYISDTFSIIDKNGSSHLYSRSDALSFAAWEKAMNTSWSCEIIRVNGDSVKVVLRESSDFYKLLGIGTRTEISEFVIQRGKIQYEIGQFGPENESGSQEESYSQFKRWLLALHPNEPDLIAPAQQLIFNGKSAPRMIYWLKKWNEDKK